MKEVLAVEIPDTAVAGAVTFGTLVFIGLASWALLMLVRLSTVVAGLEARLEERSEDHERRLTALEAASVAAQIAVHQAAHSQSSNPRD